MSGLVSFLLLQQAILGANPTSYQEALKEAQAQQRPLVVLVGATWCPGCVTMKKSVIPTLEREGGMKTVSYVTVDTDSQPDVAGQLMRGSAIPQLIVFAKTPSGKWHREQIVGEANTTEVKALISRALTAQTPAVETTAVAVGN
jgi:thioredoxin-like negative regulator of GroEL